MASLTLAPTLALTLAPTLALTLDPILTLTSQGRTAQEYEKEPKGKKFDSSYDRGSPTSFAPSGVIRGWTEAMQLMVEGDKWEMFIPSELGYGDSGQGSDIGGGDVLVFTMEILKLEGPGKPAERGPPPFTDLNGEVSLYDGWAKAAGVRALAVLRQPIGGSKLFQGFKKAARASAKAADGASFALTAASRFEKGAYTTDGVAQQLKLSGPAVFVAAPGDKWVKCKTGRPTESTVEAISAAVTQCVHAAGGKSEL